jgi:Meckel syndrome type 1 protein
VPVPPAQQVVPVAIALALLPGERASLRVALEPPELGRVEVRIARGADGGDAVRILAERPETLALLQRDQRELGRALDQAGVPAGGGISFGLAGQEGGGAGAREDRGGGGTGRGAPGSAASGQPGGASPAPPQRQARMLGLLDIAV